MPRSVLSARRLSTATSSVTASVCSLRAANESAGLCSADFVFAKYMMNAKELFAGVAEGVKSFLQKLSFRTGVIVLAMCIPFYVISFAQMALPLSASVKGVLWVIFFGLAKTAQYGGLTILGADGVRRIKARWRKRVRTDGTRSR